MRSALLVLALFGCAKQSPATASIDGYAYEEDAYPAAKASNRGYGGQPPPPPPPPPPMADAAPVDAAPEAPPPPPDAPAKAEERMVHYAGYARLRVTKVQETLDAVAAEAARRGGRVEQLTGRSIVIRVPVADFDGAWQHVRTLGDVIDESVSAEDVTDAFFAVDLRVRTLTVTRDRLVSLLAIAETEEEKITLLREIQRVTEALDQFERQLRMLRGLADYSRISVDVVPREAVGGANSGPRVAGFAWIDSLSPFYRGSGADEKRISLAVPDGMVALTPRGGFVAESPEGARLWTGRVPNDPQAPASFWIDAVVDRLGEDFASAARTTRGPWSCVTLTDGSDTPYSWDVCAQADPVDRYLLLAQAYYPSEEALGRYGPAVAASLSGGGS